MDHRAVEVGGGRWRMVKVVGWGGLCGVVLYVTAPPLPSTILHRPPRMDIHSEYVKFPSGRDTITAYLAYPERKDPAPAVVVIHEIFGMSDFIRQTAEQLAKDGFVAIAPDLLSHHGGTPPSADDARKLIAALRTSHQTYRHTVYPGVGHGFLRTREQPEVADSAWRTVIGFFRESLER